MLFSDSGLSLLVSFMEYYLLMLMVPFKVHILGRTEKNNYSYSCYRGYLIQETAQIKRRHKIKNNEFLACKNLKFLNGS